MSSIQSLPSNPDLAWLGEVPAGWGVRRIKRIVSRVDYGISESTQEEGRFSVLKMGHIQRGEIKFSGLDFVDEVSEELLLEHGDLLYNRTNSSDEVGKAAIFRGSKRDQVTFASYLVRLRANHNTSPHFLNYLLNSEGFLTYARKLAIPSVQQSNLNSTRYCGILVPLPPLEEQERIAAYLDASCMAVDTAVTAKRHQLETLDALRNSTIQRAVTQGLTESPHLVETGSQIVPRIPDGWKLTRLKRIANIRYGLGQPPAEQKGGVPMIRATNIDAGIITDKNLLHIDPDGLPLDRNPYLKEDEIIVVRSGAYTGDSAIVPSKYAGAVAGYDMVITVTRAEPKFIAYSLLSGYVLQGQILLLTLRAAQPHLNAEELGSVIVAMPSSQVDQQAIVTSLDTKLAEISLIESTIRSQIATLVAYRKSLIYECVTGKRRITEREATRVMARA